MNAIVRFVPWKAESGREYILPRIEKPCCEKFAFDVSSAGFMGPNSGSNWVSSASLVDDWKYCPWCGGQITFVNGGGL